MSSRVARFVRALALLAIVIVGVPWTLTAAAQARFGGASPLHDVAGPGSWEWDRIRSALTDRLTEQTIADIVIRVCLVVAWVAVAVLLATVVAEVVHMLRHDGLALPDIRGLGLSQSAARAIASGLLVLLPTFTWSSPAIALDGGGAGTEGRPTLTVDSARPHNTWTDRVAHPPDLPDVEAAAPSPGLAPGRGAAAGAGPGRADGRLGSGAADRYVVGSGDSIYGIAERFAGPDAVAVAGYADRLVDLNLGRSMPDGERFTNPAYIDVGWVLDLPAGPSDRVFGDVDEHTDEHVVERGETLWEIAAEELGDGDRWPEIYEENRGRVFDDGEAFDDPDLIQPGWDLDLPADDPSDDGSADADRSAEHPATADVAPERPDAESRPPTAVPATPPVVDEVLDETGVEVAADVDADVAAEMVAADGVAPPAAGERAVSPAPQPVNVWGDAATSTDAPSTDAPSTDAPSTDARGAGAPRAAEAELLTLGRAAMLSGGALALLAVRRRKRLRTARPRTRLPQPEAAATRTERLLRAIEPGDRFVRVDIAVRAAAPALIDADQRVVAVLAADDGSLELIASGPVDLGAPWEALDDAERCRLPGATPIELLADDARRVGAPCPTLVQLGRTPGGQDVYVDLEALGAVEVGGPGHLADAVVTAIGATLAGSVLAEVTTLVGLGIDDAAFLGHRHHVPVRDSQQAFERAGEAIGSTASLDRSTFELRARVTGGETWEPAVVLCGSAAGTIVLPPRRNGLAVVSASPIHGPSSRLAPDGDAWQLLPLRIRLVPVGLPPDEVAALAALVGSAEDELVADDGPALDLAHVPLAHVPRDRDHTLAPMPDDVVVNAPDREPPNGEVEAVSRTVEVPPILVRLLGPVAVESADHSVASFERSKSRELIAWLATHRNRSTRTAARTALWDLDVRDATFANVVSEARRSMARLVSPPEGEEWIGRTLNEALPLHPMIRTDADMVHEALETARLQPPDQAIATLRPAVDLIVGMPFEGTSFLWSDAEGIASQLVLLATSATSELAAHCLSIGDIDGVFHATGRGLQVLPGHESLIGLRMEAHARVGDQAGVRHEWDRYERVINADPWSDGEPSTKLVDLRRSLLAG